MRNYSSLQRFLAAIFLTVLSCTTIPNATVPRITARIEFVGGSLLGTVPKVELTDWWERKLKIGSVEPDAYNFLVGTNGPGERIRVETCQQYTDAIKQGAYALTTVDMGMDSWFQRASGALKFMEQAKQSAKPLPGDVLNNLPVSLLGWHGSDQENQLKADTRKGMTLNDYERSGKVKNLKWKRHQLSFQTEGMDFSIEELARGDVDGDGFEDALIFVTWHYQGGSGHGHEVYTVTCLTNKQDGHLMLHSQR